MNKHLSIQAYKERCRNFDLLKNGLIKKYVDEALDLEDRQEQSLFKLTDTKKDDYSLSSGYFHACTAFGKSYLIKAMAEGYFAEEKNKKIIILEENVSVLKQIKKDLLTNSSFSEDDIGTYYGNEKYPESPILVTTYASMKHMLKDVKKENIGLVLCDEAHHILSKRRQQIARQFDSASLYGFTATPHYNQDKECAQVFGNIIDSVTIRKGVESDLLCSFKNGLFISRIPIDITEAKLSSGEYDTAKLAQIMRDSHVQGMREELADFYLKSSDKELGRLNGRTTLINVPSQEEADLLADTFNQKAGKIIAKSYHTNTDEEPLKEFHQGLFPVLVQVNKLSEGYNNKNVEICINYPTGSKVRSAQRSGRALRRDNNTPDKLALIIDIAFKRRQGNDIFQEIHDNGQVLFMDVAEEGAIYSESYRQLHPEIDLIPTQIPTMTDDVDDNKNSEKSPFLFDIMTDYRDIYKLIYRHMELQEMRIKQPYDLSRYEFATRLDIFKNGQKLSFSQRENLFNELVQNPQFIKKHIVKHALSLSNKTCWTIDSRRLSELEKELNLIFVLRNLREIPLKHKTDITKEDFIRYFYVFDHNNEISPKDKRSFFDNLCDNEELLSRNLIRLVRSNVHQAFVIDGTKLDEFMQVSGIKIVKKPDILPKAETDISQDIFARKFIVTQNGKKLSKDESGPLFKQLLKNEQLLNKGIIKTVMAKNLTIQVIDGTKLDELMQITGLDLRKKLIPQETSENDITRSDFIRADYTVSKDGRQLVYQEKVKLIATLFADRSLHERGLIIPVRSDNSTVYVINGDTLDELFKQTGIKIERRDYLEEKQENDINLTFFRTDYCVFINGRELDFHEKSELFEKFCNNDDYINAGFVKNVHSNGHPIRVIDGTKFDEIKKHTGILIQKKQFKRQLKENALQVNISEVKQSFETLSKFDLSQEAFIKKCTVVVNGEPLINRDARRQLFKQLINEPKLIEAGIVKKTSSRDFYIDSSRFDEVKKLTGIIITNRDKLPQKLDTDIMKTDFIRHFIVQKGDEILSQEQKDDLFNQLIARQDELNGIIKLVQSKSTETYVIDGDRLDELSKLTGISITQRNSDDLPLKMLTDIIPSHFFANYQITDNGRILTFDEKKSCCAELLKNEELISRGIVKKVKSGSYQTLVFDGLKFEELFELTGIKLTPLTELEYKKETDIDSGVFSRDYQVIQNDRPLSVKEKAKLYKILTDDDKLKQLHLIRFVRSRSFDCWVIDGNKLDELAKLKGLSISKRETYPKQQKTDITFSNFLHDLRIVHNGNIISRDDKKDLADKIFTDERLLKLGIVRMVQSPFVTVPMIDGTRLDEFEAVTGISVQQPTVLPQRDTADIVQSDFTTRYSVLKDGEVLNKEKRFSLFNMLTENGELIEKGIIKTVKSQRHELKVIDGKRLDEVQKITGLEIITPQQKLCDLQDKFNQAKTEAERKKYQYQIHSMFEALKKRHISIQMPDKSKDK